MNEVKTRFAPSPTGELHIGSVRTALFNYLFAKHHHGKFFLRIEDTDRERTIVGSIDRIIEDLEWLGIHWEGDVMIQSRRLEIYQSKAHALVARGHAYFCFCDPSRLSKMRKEQEEGNQAPKYDRACLSMSSEEISKSLDQKRPFVIRLKIPDATLSFQDNIRGSIVIEGRDLDDQILLKSDGYPTYHLANVVDDHELGITHVIRAEEWLPSTAKHIVLYQAFGWSIPEFAHIPLILNENRSKMSKRRDGEWVWMRTYRDLGYLPEAMINYLAFLGWNPKDEREFFSLNELVKEFSLNHVHRAGAIFSRSRLDFMNSRHIRGLSMKSLNGYLRPFLERAGFHNEKILDDYLEKVIALEKDRFHYFAEFPEIAGYFFHDGYSLNPDDLAWKNNSKNFTKNVLIQMIEFLKTIPEEEFDRKTLESKILEWIQRKSLDNGSALWPFRFALTGMKKTPGPFEIAEILGKQKVLRRCEKAVSLL